MLIREFSPISHRFSLPDFGSAYVAVNSPNRLKGKLVFWFKYACFLYLTLIKFAIKHRHSGIIDGMLSLD